MIIRPKVKLPIVIIRCKSALNIFGWNGGTEGKIPAWILTPKEIVEFFNSSFGDDCSQPGDLVIRLDEYGNLKK